MSGVAIVRYLLANNAALIASVPAARIMSGVLPLDTARPAISVTKISGLQENTLAMASASYLVRDRVQVTVLADTYPLVKSTLALIRAALPLSRGAVNGFTCEGVIPDIEGPDLFDPETLIHQGSADYMVSFIR